MRSGYTPRPIHGGLGETRAGHNMNIAFSYYETNNEVRVSTPENRTTIFTKTGEFKRCELWLCPNWVKTHKIHRDWYIYEYFPAFWREVCYIDHVLCLPLPVELIVRVRDYLKPFV